MLRPDRSDTLAVLFATGILVVLGIPFLGDLYVMDEAVFVRGIYAIAERGIPYYYKSVQAGWNYALWHPPSYVYFVGIMSSVFGTSEVAVRGSTYLFTVATVPVLFALTRTIVVKGDRFTQVQRTWAPRVAVAFYALSPVVVQNGTLVDIDGSILSLITTALLVWLFANVSDDDPIDVRSVIFLAGWFATLAWIKFGPLPVLIAATVGYVLIKRGLTETVRTVVAICMGLGLFAVTWWLIADALGLSFARPFVHNFGMLLEPSSGASMSGAKRLLLSGWTLYTEILWLSPFLVLLALIPLVTREWTDIPSCLRSRTPELTCLFVAFATIGQYAVLAKLPYGFPKYVGPATPLLCALAGCGVAKVVPNSVDWRQICVGGGAILITAAVTIATGDPFLAPFQRGFDAVVLHTAVTIGAFFGLFVGVLLLVDRFSSGFTRRQAVSVALIVLLLGTNVGVLALQVNADYSTRYFYGQQGMEKTVEDVRDTYASLPPNAQKEVVAPTDIGFYLNAEFTDEDPYDSDQFEKDRPPVVVLRTDEYYRVTSPLLQKLRRSENYTARTHGSFVVFERTD